MSTNSTSEPRELVETPDLNGAYPRLDEAGIAALAPLGRRRVQPEEVLFREGDRDCQFFVVLAGMVVSVEGYGTAEENVISVPGRGWTVVMGVLSVLAGLLILVYPAISLLTLVVVLSVWLLVLGLMEITLAIRARSAGRRIEDRALHPV